MENPNLSRSSSLPFALELQQLLYPSLVFEHPGDVVRDPKLTTDEKRAILASWASDACAVEAAPGLRSAPDGHVVSVNAILGALRSLDQEVHEERAKPRSRDRRIRRHIDSLFQGVGGCERTV
jgi:hypothetical protein